VKWADSALIGGDVLVLLEVKTIPMRKAIGSSARRIPADLVALVAGDPDATAIHPRGSDTYVDERWWEARSRFTTAWGVMLAAVHGDKPIDAAEPLLEAEVQKGLQSVEGRCMDHAGSDAWIAATRRAVEAPLVVRHRITGSRGQGSFYAFAAPLVGVTVAHSQPT
jgi:hypothetical protein